jgi:hypothetical protein
MKIKTLLIIIQFLAVIIFNSTLTAQDPSDFLPLQVGNVWVYQCNTGGSFCGGCSGRTRVSISGSSVINGRVYYQREIAGRILSGNCNSCGSTFYLPFSSAVRVDSQSANVFLTSTSGCSYTPGEVMLDSFKAKLRDSIRMNCQPPTQWGAYVCTDTNNVTLFGSQWQSRIYTLDGFEGGYQRRYAMGIGCYYVFSTALEGGTYVCNRSMTLLGCVINGVLYGDTSMLLGINMISSEIPLTYSLYQNYPNPFNPVTNIKFDLPKSGYVEIKIFDIQGREIAQLVNQQMQPGVYSVNWDASNYPSGVYFYKIEAGDYKESKRMVLIK